MAWCIKRTQDRFVLVATGSEPLPAAWAPVHALRVLGWRPIEFKDAFEALLVGRWMLPMEPAWEPEELSEETA